ncbi:MAG: hypothetical protein U5K79_04155 [Cyclobacteriaceae bacterium]|nr:hypothetical protein [Cyclobacteriaceae bacterium]
MTIRRNEPSESKTLISQIRGFNNNAQPFYVILDQEVKTYSWRPGPMIWIFPAFIDFLDKAKAAYQISSSKINSSAD